MAANPFHQLDVIRNASHKGKRITDCYRLMYKKELWIKAYNKLYPFGGSLVKGSAEEITDRFPLQKMNEIIDQLKAGTFRFAPVRRGNISAANGKKRSQNVPRLTDRLVQEVIRMILENVFEPVFSENSHGFREGRSCHTALSQIKSAWKGATWCIGGNVTGIFPGLNHSVLLKLISRKVNDNRFLLLIQNALSSGVIESWNDQKTYSETLQRGIISPLLANIYLHEFDKFIEKQIELSSLDTLNKKNQRIKYVRYAGEFVVGITGSKQAAMNLKEMINVFFKEELRLELSETELRLTHLGNPVPFLGYEFRKWGEQNAASVLLEKRTLSGAIKLEIPEKKIKEFALTNGYGSLDNFKTIHRTKLINHSEIEILYAYNAELKEIANYYKLANNYHHLDKLFFLAESSFIKTIANKRKSTSRKVASSMRTHKQGVLCLVRKDTNGNEKLCQFLRLKDLPKYKGGIPVDSAKKTF